jgi:hypothetical protein
MMMIMMLVPTQPVNDLPTESVFIVDKRSESVHLRGGAIDPEAGFGV